jgi:protein-tyrosine-phosphatase
LRALGGKTVEVFSAGSEPTSIHPLAAKVMLTRRIDLTTHRSKHLKEFLGEDFDYVITVCDRVRESCPVFPGDPEQIHWSFPDPAAVEGKLEPKERAFEETAREMTNRIQYLLLIIDRAQQAKR